MRVALRRGLCVLLLIQAALLASLAPGQVSGSFGFRFHYPPGWANILGLLVGSGLALTVGIRLGVWLLVREQRWATVLLAALGCTLADAAILLLTVALVRAQGPTVFRGLSIASALAVVTGGLLFAGGVLVCVLAPRWVAWLGVAGAAITIPNLLLGQTTNGLLLLNVTPVSALLVDISYVLDLVFLIGLAVSLLAGASPKEPASTARIDGAEHAPSTSA